MSGGKKRSSFQITSITSEPKQSLNLQAGQSSPGAVQGIQSEELLLCNLQRSSSQPTISSLKRKYISHDALGPGCSSRFRVVKLAGGAGGRGCGTYRRGRWTCTEFPERLVGRGFKRLMDTMRQAHSLDSLEIIGKDKERGGADQMPHPVKRVELLSHSQPQSSTYEEPIRIQQQEKTEPISAHGLNTCPPVPSPRPKHLPKLKLDMDTMGRSVLRLSQSLPSSPPSEPYHPTLTPIQTAFMLDQDIFNFPEVSSVSSNSLLAIDNKIEQAMDLVKSHLMLAVREEVELLRQQIRELQEKNQQLERENHILRTLTMSTKHNANTT